MQQAPHSCTGPTPPPTATQSYVKPPQEGRAPSPWAKPLQAGAILPTPCFPKPLKWGFRLDLAQNPFPSPNSGSPNLPRSLGSCHLGWCMVELVGSPRNAPWPTVQSGPMPEHPHVPAPKGQSPPPKSQWPPPTSHKTRTASHHLPPSASLTCLPPTQGGMHAPLYPLYPLAEGFDTLAQADPIRHCEARDEYSKVLPALEKYMWGFGDTRETV